MNIIFYTSHWRTLSQLPLERQHINTHLELQSKTNPYIYLDPFTTFLLLVVKDNREIYRHYPDLNLRRIMKNAGGCALAARHKTTQTITKLKQGVPIYF